MAVTRAKTSVVMALRSKPSDKNNKKLYKLMQDGWAPPQTDDLDGQPEHNPLSRIQYKFHQEPDSLDQLPSGHVTVSDQAGASLHVPDYQGITQWQQASPSTVAGSLHKKRKAELAEQIKASAIRREGGFIPPAYKLVESPQGQVWKDLRPSWWGTLIHGWFEQWRFIGQPSKEAITDYLKEHMEGDSSPAADFLYTISTRLMENREHPLWKVVTAPGARLHFERPFVGLGHLPSGGEGAGQGSTHGTGVTPGTQQYLVTGSMDLLVENPDGTWQVIDFKAGNKSPDQETSIITDAHLRTYGPQMEAYRTMVNQALAANTPPTTTPPRVSQVSLWFVRTGASLSW